MAPNNLDRFGSSLADNASSAYLFNPGSFLTSAAGDKATFSGGGTVSFVTTGTDGTVADAFSGGNIDAHSVTRSYLEVSVTYTYVPESSWAGLAAGAGLVGWALARRRA